MPTPCPRQGLYAITREGASEPARLLAEVEAALRGGVAILQYRAKQPAPSADVATALLALCRSAGVPLIINDDIDLATRIGADGVHLGRQDGSLGEARRRLGDAAILGVSCYDSVERALQAEAEGASYVAFGRFFPSLTKPDAPCARLETLREARRRLRLPVVAIGGITSDNAAELLEAGAALLAVIEGVFGADDPERAARGFKSLWEPASDNAPD